MTKIQLSPEELIAQAGNLDSLRAEYEALFANVISVLNDTNGNWSENLSHNFSSKIASAQKSFSNIVDMLDFGAEAAKESAIGFSTVDSALSKKLAGQTNGNRYGTSINAGTVASGTDDVTPSLMSSLSEEKDKDMNTVTITGDIEKDVKQFYHDRMNSSEDSSNGKIYEYETRGSTTGKQKLIEDLYYEKTYDVRKYYGKYDKDSSSETASGGMSITGTEIKISSGSEDAVTVKLNTMDVHGTSSYKPKEGTVYVSAGAEYDIASVDASIGDAQNGFGSATVGLKAGLGGGVDVGVKNGIFTCKISGAFFLGAEVKFDINYGNLWNAFCDSIKHPVI